MLVDLQGPFTVADNYSLNLYGEIGLAAGTRPLPTPTDVADPADPAAVAAVQADNAARSVTLDDGSSWNYLTNATGKNTPLPYLTQDSQIRVGEPVTFTTPMVLDYRNNAWKLQPTAQLTGDGARPAATCTSPRSTCSTTSRRPGRSSSPPAAAARPTRTARATR
jgi:predicted extracellular nuclease